MAAKKVNKMMGYKTYNFIDKDPVIDLLRTAVKLSGLSYAQIAERSGVSDGTLYNWFNGDTRRPQFASVQAVARAVGHEFRMLDRAQRKNAA